MVKKTAIRLHVEVGADHLVRLPDSVPAGPVDLIVLVPNGAAPQPRSLLGLFADDPAAADDALAGARELRSQRATSRTPA
jgi:hypothetical protein